MNYIYDILVNFQPYLYSFYDWNKEDELSHIRKVPLFRVTPETLLEMKEKQFQLPLSLQKIIYQKTEIFTSKNAKKIDYACIFSSNLEAYIFTFDQNGMVKGKSCLLLDEEEEVIEIVEHLDILEESFTFFNQKKYDTFKTRQECELEGYLKSQLKKLEVEKSLEKLKYLYYECFGEKKDRKGEMLQTLYTTLEVDFDSIARPLYHFFKMTSGSVLTRK